MTQPEMSDVFRFMELRAPFSPDAEALRQNYIRDDTVDREGKPARIDADLQSAQSQSAVGRLVYEYVFCVAGSDDPAENLQRLMNALLRLLDPYRPRCAGDDDLGAPASETDPRVPVALQLFELERSPHIVVGDVYYLLPERLERISGLPLFPALYRASELMAGARTKGDLAKLVKDLEAAFGGKALREVVFHDGAYSNDFRDAKRRLYDTLYLLYLLRGRAPVNLEHVIEGLRVLHVVEALAVDGLIDAVHAGPLAPSDQLLLGTLEVLFPELHGWNGVDPLTALPSRSSGTSTAGDATGMEGRMALNRARRCWPRAAVSRTETSRSRCATEAGWSVGSVIRRNVMRRHAIAPPALPSGAVILRILRTLEHAVRTRSPRRPRHPTGCRPRQTPAR